MKHFYSQIKNFLNIALFLGIFLQGYLGNAQTTLVAGDILFTGYDSNFAPAVGDEYSFVLLKAISANTVISFSDRGYTGSGWQAAGGTEGTVTWTSGSALGIGTEVLIKGVSASVYNVTTSSLTPNGTVTLTEGSSANGLSLSTVGDQIIAFQGGSGSISAGGVTFITGLHYFYCNASTTSATWDSGACVASVNSSRIPVGLTGGTNAFYTGTLSGNVLATSARFNGTGPFADAAAIKAAVINQSNWTLSTTPLTMPSTAPFTGVPATINTSPTSLTRCVGGSATFTVAASNATGFQWQVNTGSGYNNVPNAAPYSGGTTASLTVSPTTASMNGYLYQCVVTGTGGNATSGAATLTVPTITGTTSAQINVSCNGGTNGSATITPAGGTGPYTYSWSPSGGSAAAATGLGAGTYTVTITDANSCTGTQTVNITQPTVLVASVGGQTNVSCLGGSNGTATVIATGGTTGYTYSWAPSGGTAATATGLAQGTYTVTVTDANSCTATQSFTITQPATAVSAAANGQTNVSCNGGNNGTATVLAAGGTGAYTYSWAPSGGTAATATGLSVGVYVVTVRDANLCQATQSFTITQPPALTAAPVSQTNIACNGGTTGAATVSASGGTGTYTYSWSPSGGTAASATGLGAGTYTVTVTDANSCTATQNFTITEPAALTASAASQTNVSCNSGTNGSATVSATGGTGAYTYSWAPSGGTADTATGLSAGTYTVTVTDANLCTATQSFTITEPAVLTATAGAQTNVSCNSGANGTATVSVTGGTPGYTYSWAPSGGTAVTATGLSAGTYTVTVTDANSCTATQSFTITEPTALTASASAQTNTSCNGGANGSATVSATGGTPGYTYSWAPSGGTAATATGLTAGTYTVTVTDANSCSATQSFTITEPAALIAVPVAQTNIACNGATTGAATVSASGGTGSYTYSWAPSGGTAATATGLSAGTYTVTVTDANSCTATQSFTITEPSVLTASAGAQTNTSCNSGANGTATVIAAGGTPGYTYSWAPSGGTGATATGLSAGTYTVTVTDANSCTATQSFTITEPTILTATAGTQTNVSCNSGANGTATVSVTGGTPGYTYSWAPSGGTAATASGLSAGTYTVTVTDANSCSATQSFTITEPTVLTATAAAQTNVSCNSGTNGSATVSVTGGTGSYTYSWSPSGGTAATATGLSAGTYTVTVTDANSCSATQSFTITQPATLVAAPVSQTNIACNGGTTGAATVTASGGTGSYTYSWAPSGGTAASATGLAAGTYTVTVTDANLCTATQSFTITQPSVLTASASAQTNTSCNGGANGSATVIAAGGTPGYTYSWAPSGGTGATATGLSAGTYIVTVTDANACTTTQSFTITEPTVLNATAASQTNVSCNSGSNGSATVSVIGGTPGYTYSWAPTGGTAATASGLSAGTYTVTVTDANACTATQSFTITEPAALIATAGPKTNVLCNGGATGSATVNVTGGTAGYTYSWAPSGGTAVTATGLSIGSYTVTVTDANGCTATQSFTILQPPVLAATTSQIDATCSVGGQASVTPSGGTAPYTYLWTPTGDTTAAVTDLVAGNHSVVITDANGCSITKNFTIGTTNTLVATQSKIDVLCNGGNTGSATVVPSGAPGPFTYVWSPSGGTAATATGLTAGNYSVIITSANGCSTVKNFTITEPTALTASAASQTNIVCNSAATGSATVNATGGTGAYTYSWTPSGGTATTATGLTAGTYTVTVTDANLCTATQSFTITEPAAIVATASQTNVSCNSGTNGSATVNVTGGTGAYTYAWAPSGGTAATATGLAAGTYTVTITDANLCTATQSFTITQPAALTATAGAQTNVLCNGGATGSATVNVTGGTTAYTYSWAPSGGTAATATGLTAGTYTVTVTDANACTATQTFTITQPAALIATAGPKTNVSCNSGSNGSATVNVTGGTAAYTYSWAPSGGTAATATGLTAGTYTATVTDANGCTATQSFTITQPTALIATAGTQTNVSCNSGSNGSATVNVTGGTGAYTYSWSPSGGTTATATGLTAGTYTVTVTDANLCTATQTFTITQPAALTATTSQIDVVCIGQTNGSATVVVSGGTGAYTYAWSPSGGTAATATGLAAGNYTVLITDANACTLTKSFSIITIPDVTKPVPNVTNLPDITNYCSILAAEIAIPTATDNCAGTITGTTTSPLNYTSEGTYVITWSYDDGHGNISTQNQTLKVIATPLAAVTFTNAAYTYNGSLRTIQVQNLPVGASVAYAITPASSTLNGATNAGVYTITATVSPAASMPNCSPIVLTATLTINKAPQVITFGAIPVKTIGGTNTFNLDATSNSALAVRYSYTYTSALPAATVSNTGVVNLLRAGQVLITAHQDGDSNYLPAADVSQVLIIKNNNAVIPKITLGTMVYLNPPKDITYVMACGEPNLNVTIVNDMNATITPSTNFTINSPKPGIYKQIVTVTSEDGSVVNTYNITVEKPFGFYDIVHQKFNNVLLVNNNPQTNGGYSFASYQWFKNGQLIGTGQYYSAGNGVGDALDPTADYKVVLTTTDGKVLQTCASKITVQNNTLQAKLYPNPIETGKVVTVEADFPEEELKNMQISLYSVSGQLIKTVQSSTVKTEIQLPETSDGNMYLVVIESANIKKSLKVIVK
ncbi:putative secreted protein (Por secretion system target) [Flavobacterium sp. 270]|uniref:T9SS type A sorting domain-containing protein n=1 Tax=Flavobacterium sp. 270 TaxID=2512114 RepID=UPI0010652AE4|nr:T9SS type A sorting domain-containing protein [Flavobacterium sp. 270]TDW51787.1 putative secreted protein (Por secretion system target) [Flavobacterium sp. 270]